MSWLPCTQSRWQTVFGHLGVQYLLLHGHWQLKEENKELMLFHQQEDSKTTLSLSPVHADSCPQPVWLQGSSNCTTLVNPEARNLSLLTWSHHIILEINFKIRRTDLQPDHSSVSLLRHRLLPNAC